MSESRSQGKPFDIPKSMVWEAYQRVKANKGAAGVDGQSVEQFGRVNPIWPHLLLCFGPTRASAI